MFEKFFADPSFDFETRTLLGGIHYGAGDVGEMLTAVANISDGDATSWVNEYRALAERIQGKGDACLKAGHRVSARGAYLRAAVYYAAACVFVDGTENPDAQLTELFAAHRRCFDQHVGLLDPPAIPIAVPYEDSDLPGYLFVPGDDGVARPTVILTNGSDGAMTFLWPGLGQPGRYRPGQSRSTSARLPDLLLANLGVSWIERREPCLRVGAGIGRAGVNVAPHVRERQRSTAALASTSWLLRTSTGSLVAGAGTAALLLAAGVNRG